MYEYFLEYLANPRHSHCGNRHFDWQLIDSEQGTVRITLTLTSAQFIE